MSTVKENRVAINISHAWISFANLNFSWSILRDVKVKEDDANGLIQERSRKFIIDRAGSRESQEQLASRALQQRAEVNYACKGRAKRCARNFMPAGVPLEGIER